ncbi:MAG: EAL domain-containing protein [Lachnospiraceae bacterium]|nr:EAL domain-containing protein [Lachnospiraceae bacterium]
METVNVSGSALAHKVDIDAKWLQNLQDYYARMSNLFLFLLNDEGQQVTALSGDRVLVDRLVPAISDRQIKHVYERLMNSSTEDQIVEDTDYSNVKIAGIAIKVDGIAAICWIVCAVLEEINDDDSLLNFSVKIKEADFIASLDFLRLISTKVYKTTYSRADALAESVKSKSAELQMMHDLRKSEFMTDIVSLLDSDESFEEICSQMVTYVGRFSDIAHAYVLRININGTGIDLLGEYLKEGRDSLHGIVKVDDVIKHIKIAGDKPMVISYKTVLEKETREWFSSLGITSCVIIPVFTSKPNRQVAMYVVFADDAPGRMWNSEEIKFFGDAGRIIQSILEKRVQKNSLASSYKSLESILDNVGTAIYVRDIESGQILFANRLFRNSFKDELENGMIERLFEKKAENSNRSVSSEVEYADRRRWYDLNNTYIRWVDGRRVLLCSIFDITDKKLYQQKIEQQANNDFLTGLYNRMSCERDLAKFIDGAKQSNSKGALLYLDLDDFKHINDGLGHQYGDVLLKAISHCLSRIDGVENSCYRMGGDEFIIIIPHTSMGKFDAIIEEIRVVFNKPWFLKGADYYCTTSMGIVTFPDEGDTVQDVIKKADIAMYEAKRGGKNRTAYYSDSRDSDSNKRLDMEKSMREATTSDYKEFEVYYQPIIDTQGGGICTGAEALIRWNSSELGFVSPGDFIPLAEYLGLINPIGNYVLREACLACKHWNESGHPYYKVNVNLSVVQLLQNDVVETIENIIKETGINPRNLTLEVTESLAINDMERMKRILSSIKKLGVRIALDDFGTGYSSLSHIREIPLDVIKVDQSFVKDLAVDQYAQAFVRMVGELAEALEVKICVEGIETEEQLRVLDDMNIRLIQGFYFDKPMRRYVFEEKYVVNCPDQMNIPEGFFDPLQQLTNEDRSILY